MIVITGATGKTGSQTVSQLLSQGKKVRAVARSREKLSGFQDKGAEILAGDLGELSFLTKALEGAEAAYLLVPPKFDAPDVRAYYNEYGDLFAQAIRASGVTKVVLLSSLGAEHDQGTGPVKGLHDIEEKLKPLSGVNLIFFRPSYFMENLFWNMQTIKEQGIMGSPTSPDTPVCMVATPDIGDKAAELLSSDFHGIRVEELYGDRISFSQAAGILGKAIDKNISYVQFPSDAARGAMQAMGLSPDLAANYVELAEGLDKGLLAPNSTPEPNAPTRLAAFAQNVFKPAYQAG